MEGITHPIPRTVEEVFQDFKGRRAGLIKALTIDVDKFYQQCDPEKENLCLYGLPNETWEVNLPVEEVPPELPEPALGINFARDGMQEKDWLSLVAVHSDSWLLAVAFYFGARFGFGKNERKRLFQMINDLPTIFEVVTGNVKQPKDQSATHNSSKSKSSGKMSRQSEPQAKGVKTSPPPNKEEDESGEEEEDDEQGATCGACGDNYGTDEFWICCDVCERWFHGKCVKITPAFLLKAVHQEAFTYMHGQKEFVQIDHNDLYPYLLVNIGSGVSMLKVDGEGKFERVSGTNVGGGTFWGLGRLLTNCKSFDELLELSHKGNNRVIDMLVGDIYGGMDYSKVGLSSTTIASSFGKAISDNKELADYRPEDISRSLLRMISNNIGQISYLNALRFGLKRIFFGGFFIGGHAYTMDTISVAVHFWSKGEAKAMFLRHEGFLGALGAFMSYGKHGFDDLMFHQLIQSASLAGDKIGSPPNGKSSENESIECSIYAS